MSSSDRTVKRNRVCNFFISFYNTAVNTWPNDHRGRHCPRLFMGLLLHLTRTEAKYEFETYKLSSCAVRQSGLVYLPIRQSVRCQSKWRLVYFASPGGSWSLKKKQLYLWEGERLGGEAATFTREEGINEWKMFFFKVRDKKKRGFKRTCVPARLLPSGHQGLSVQRSLCVCERRTHTRTCTPTRIRTRTHTHTHTRTRTCTCTCTCTCTYIYEMEINFFFC